jgi:hypothetical protein
MAMNSGNGKREPAIIERTTINIWRRLFFGGALSGSSLWVEAVARYKLFNFIFSKTFLRMYTPNKRMPLVN